MQNTEKELTAQELRKITGEGNLLTKEPMSRYTTFKTGGPADFLAQPETPETLTRLIAYCREKALPFLLLGRGSNLLVSDSGYQGLVISMRKFFNEICLDEETGIMELQAGVMMPAAAQYAMERGFSGLEFASGIPGTIGGGVLMNAGAYGSELASVLVDVDVLEPDGRRHQVPAEEAALGYRTSAFLETERVILGCRLQLKPGDKEEIRSVMNELNEKRRDKQPLEYGSAGSTFKRPTGYFAGKLIQDAGMKGFQIGGAMVSEKHAGFVINRENASSADVYRVCREVQKKVLEQFGVELELEVRLAGSFEKV